MSGSLTEIAARLADEVIAIQDASGEERLFMEVSKVIGASSQTLEEAFLTEVRIRMAERKAQDFIRTKATQLGVARPAPQARR